MSQSDANIIQYAVSIYSKDPNGVLGPWIVGALADAFFMGLLWTQVTNYYQWFPRDSKWIKGLVALITIISCVKFFQSCYTTWLKFVTEFGDWLRIVNIGWEIYMIPVFGQALSFCAQLFFSWRCFTLMRRNWYILAFLLMSITTSFALSIVVGYRYATDQLNSSAIQKFSAPQLALNIINDLLISAIVTVRLTQSRSGFNATTDTALKRLLAITWGAGIPPTISATLDMITFFTMPRNLVHVLFNMLTGRLYVFSMMYALNSRASIRTMLNQAPALPSHEITATTPRFRSRRGSSSFGDDVDPDGWTHPLSSIKVETEKVTLYSQDRDIPVPHLSRPQSVAFKVSAYETGSRVSVMPRDSTDDFLYILSL
ncbi:hypothetical protein FRB90_001713 [Tulasnella sp. 427]|nr:hypothetical protein FRB90_001713 [Tulasnella sp. 427]